MARRTFTSSLPAFRLLRAALVMGMFLLLIAWARIEVGNLLSQPGITLFTNPETTESIRNVLDVALWLGIGLFLAAMVFTLLRSSRDHEDIR